MMMMVMTMGDAVYNKDPDARGQLYELITLEVFVTLLIPHIPTQPAACRKAFYHATGITIDWCGTDSPPSAANTAYTLLFVAIAPSGSQRRGATETYKPARTIEVSGGQHALHQILYL